MRIVHITEHYPPRNHPISTQVQGLAHRQGGQGHAVHVLAASPMDIVEPHQSRYRVSTTDAPGVRVHRLASPLSFGFPVLPRGKATVERALGLLRPDVVHLHLPGPSPFGYDAARAVRGMDLPLAITAYSGAPETFAKFAVRLAGWATAPVATSGVSEAVAYQTQEVFGGHHMVVPFGVDLAQWRRAGRKRRPHRDLRVLIYAGEGKKIETAIQDLTGVAVSVIGPNAHHVKSASVSLGDPPHEVIPALGEDHDVYVSTTQLDPHVAGAIASGLIVLGPQGSRVEELIGGGGVVGEPGARVGGFVTTTPETLRAALVSLADSPRLRQRMVEANQHLHVASHDWDQVLNTAKELYTHARYQRDRLLGPPPPE